MLLYLKRFKLPVNPTESPFLRSFDQDQTKEINQSIIIYSGKQIEFSHIESKPLTYFLEKYAYLYAELRFG